MRLVIDTNILFPAFNPKSRYHQIVQGLFSNRFDLLISTPILLEYEEILQRVFPENLLENFWLFLLASENIIFVSPSFRFQLPFADEDDQKFVDCAVCGNADFLVTNDKHFNILKRVDFPKVEIITGDRFIHRRF
ncbi:MAG: putative toxin-antitoxin system toxin component, PIN family [Desulfococcaceae bacterium]